MELELGLKVTRTREDVSSSVDFRFSKDPFGPLVLSQETDSRFIIIIHLKGFKKEGIEIDINEEGNRITVGGRKPVQEMVMIRWMAWRKEVEMRTFKKVFRIPDMVDLDKIIARFDDDDATLTITMPKRVKGISGFEIEEEEEEERAEFGDVSKVENREETENGEVIEESEDDDNLEKTQQIDEQQEDKISEFAEEEEETIGQHELADSNKESDDCRLRKLPKIEEEENSQEVMEQQGSQENTKSDDAESKIQDKAEDEEEERVEKKKIVETEVKNGDAKEEVDGKMGEGFTPNIERTQEDDTKAKEFESDTPQESFVGEVTLGQQELVSSNKETGEDSSRKFSDIEGKDPHDHTRPKKQGDDQDVKRFSQEKTETGDFGSRAFEEIEEKEPHEFDRTCTCGEMEKKMTDDDHHGDGLSKVQGIEEPERGNEESKIQEVVEGELGEEKKKTVKMDTKNKDAEEEVDANMGERFAPNIAETEIKAEFGSDKRELDEVDKINEVVEEKQEEVENAKVGGIQSEDNNLIKLQETEEQHSKGPKRQETMEELVEEKISKAETNIENDTPQPVQETEVYEMDTLAKTGDEGKEGKEEIRNGDAEVEVDAKTGERFTPKIAETTTKTGNVVSDKLEVDEADKKEEEKENAKVDTKSRDVGDQQFQRHGKQEKIKELVKDQTPKAETNLAYDTLKPVEERCEEKQKNQAGEYKEKFMETGKKINDVGSTKVQEMIGQEDLDEPARCEKESKTLELVKSKTTDAEKEDKETAEMEIKERESCIPKTLGEQEKFQGIAQVKTDCSKDGEVREEDEIAENKTEFGDDDISRKAQDIEQQDSDAKEEVDAKMEKGSTPSTAESETKSQEFESDEMEKMHELVEKKEEEEENGKVRSQSKDSSLIKRLQENEEQQFQEQKLRDKQENNQREERREKVVETGNDADSTKVQEITQHDLDEQAKYEKESKTNDKEKKEKEIAEAVIKEQDVYRPKILGEQDKIQELAEEETKKFSKIGKIREEEDIAEKKRVFGDGHIPRKVRDIEQHDSLPKEEVDAEKGEGVIPNIAETAKNAEEFESDHKVKSDEIYKTHEPVEEKEEDEENVKVRIQSAEGSLMKKVQETNEKQFQGQTKHNKQEKIKKLVKEEPEAEMEMKEQESYRPKILREEENSKELVEEKNNFSRKVEENAEKKTEFGDDDMSGKVGDLKQQDSDAMKGQEENDKIQELVEEYKEEIKDTEKRINDAGARKVQDLIGKQELEEPGRCEKESKVRELVKTKTNDAEKANEETAETERKKQESYRPKVLGEQELVEEKTDFSKNGEVKEEEEIAEKKIEFCNDDISRKVQDSDATEEFTAEMGEGVTSNTVEKETKVAEFESDKLEADEELGELFDKKEEENENATLGTESKDIGLIKLQEIGEQRFEGEKKIPEAETSTSKDIPKPVEEIEAPEVTSKRFEGEHKIEKLFQEEIDNLREEYKEKAVDTEEKINDVGSRKVQDIIRQKDLDEQEKYEKESKTNDEEKAEKQIAETKTKEKDSAGPKILREHEKIQELAEEKNTNFSKRGGEEEIAEKKTEYSEDDMSTKVRDIEQGDSDAVKRQEEKEKFQELVMGEKLSDGCKGIIEVAENNKSRKAEEIDEQQSHEKDTSGEQFQKITEGDTSGDGEVEDVENKKKTIEPDKRIKDSTREVQEIGKKGSYVSGKNGKGTTIQEFQEQEKKDEANKLEKISSTVEQSVNLNSQLKQDDVEDGEKTQELAEEKIKDCEEEEGSEELKPRDDDDLVRKVQEQESYEPKEVVQKKTDDHENEKEKEVAESEIEAGFGDLSRVYSVEEEELPEPKIHKEPNNSRIKEAEVPNGQKEEEKEQIIESQATTENDNFPNDQYNKVKGPEKLESHEEEPQENKNCTETKDGSLRKVQDDEDPELSTPCKRQEDKLQELVEMGTSDYREKVKKQDEDDILKSQEAGSLDLDEVERHGDQSNIPQAVEEEKIANISELGKKIEDDSSGKFIEDLTHEERKKGKKLVREEATDPKDKHSGGKGHYDQQQEEKFIGKEELRTEKDRSKKVQAVEKQEYDKSKRPMIQEKMQKTEEKEKIIAMEENEIMEGRKKDHDGSLREVGDDQVPESSKQEEDKIQEPVEMKTSGYNEIVKKQDEDDILRSQEVERHSERSNIPQLMEEEKREGRKENNKSGEKMEGDGLGIFQKQKSNKNWRQEESEETGNLVKDKHTGREGGHKQVSHPKTKVEDDIYKKAPDSEEQKEDKQEQYGQLDTLEGVREGASNLEKDEENPVGNFTGKIQETGKEDLHGSEMDKKLDIVYDFLDDKTDAQGNEKAEEAVVAKTDNRNSRNVQMIEEEPEKTEKHREQNNVFRTSDPNVKEEDEERVGEKATREQEAHELEMHRIPDIVQPSAEDETGDQEDENAEGAAAAVAKDETKISRKVQTTDAQELEESEKHKGQNKISETTDPEVKEEDEERVANKYAEEEAPNSNKVRETKEKEAHVQELDGKTEKTEDCRDEDGEGSGSNEGKQGENVENVSGARFKTRSDDGPLRNTQETSVQEPKDKKDQELKDKTKELERKETSNHEVKLVVEDDSLRERHEVLEEEPSNVSKRRPMDKGKIQELRKVEKGEDEEKGESMTKPGDGKSRTFEPSKLLELDDSEEKEELKKIREPVEENRKSPEKENDKFAKEKSQEKIDSRSKDQEMKRQEPYALQKNRESGKIPGYRRDEEKGMEHKQIEEMNRAKDVSSGKVQQIGAEESDGSEKHRKRTEIQENRDIKELLEEKTQEPEEMNEEECEVQRRKKSMEDSSMYQDVEEKGLMVEEERREVYENDDKREKEEQKNKTERILQVEPKSNSRKSETKEQESTREKNQEVLEREISNQRKEEVEDVGKGETTEYDWSSKIQDNKNQKSDKLERHGEQEMAEEQELAVRHKEQDKKKALVKKDIVSQAEQKEDQEETRNTDDSSRKIKGKEKQEFDEQKRNEEQDKNLGLVRETTNDRRNQEDGKGDKETVDARKLKGVEERESTEVEKHENQDDIQELREENVANQEEEDDESTIKEFEEKSEDHESTRPVRLKEKDKVREPVQQKREKLKHEETGETETRSKDSEPRKIQEIKEQEKSVQMKPEEQERIQNLVEDRKCYIVKEKNRGRDIEDGSSKTIQEMDKEEPIQTKRDEKRDKIQELLDRETSEDDTEELEVEVEDSEEDWEAEVIQETDSNEDNDKIRQIRRIKLGFQLVGGSALFMSLIVIVIRFIHSKKKIRSYK